MCGDQWDCETLIGDTTAAFQSFAALLMFCHPHFAAGMLAMFVVVWWVMGRRHGIWTLNALGMFSGATGTASLTLVHSVPVPTAH